MKLDPDLKLTNPRKSWHLLKSFLNFWASNPLIHQRSSRCAKRKNWRETHFCLQVLWGIVSATQPCFHKCKKDPRWKDSWKYYSSWTDPYEIPLSCSWQKIQQTRKARIARENISSI